MRMPINRLDKKLHGKLKQALRKPDNKYEAIITNLGKNRGLTRTGQR